MDFRSILTLGILYVAGGSVESSPRVVCYYGSFAHGIAGNGRLLPSDIDPHLCTHVIYAHIDLGGEGEVVLLDEAFDIGPNGLAKFAALKKLNSDLVTMVAIGHYASGSTNFSKVSANETLRQTFASNIVRFLERHDLQGLDVDWEYPARRTGSTPQDKENFVLLLEAVKAVFRPRGFVLSAAVSATQWTINLSYDVAGLDKALDFINVMTYDLHGTWDNATGANAPLYPQPSDPSYTTLTVNTSINAWISSGATPSKLNIGLGNYGRAYTLADASNNGTGAPIATTAEYRAPYTGSTASWTYLELCSDQKNNTNAWTIVNYNDSYVYGIKDRLWVGYDDPATMHAKGAYAKSKHLGGVMFWALHGDDFRGYCGEKWPLINAAVDGYNVQA